MNKRKGFLDGVYCTKFNRKKREPGDGSEDEVQGFYNSGIGKRRQMTGRPDSIMKVQEIAESRR